MTRTHAASRGEHASTRIAVVGGSEYDTRLGCDLLRARDVACEGFALAPDSVRQGRLQAADPARLADTIQSLRARLAEQQFSKMLLFCNSAATTLVGSGIDEDAPIPILSPLIVFRALGTRFARLLLIGSRTRALSVIEQIVRQADPQIEVAGFADPMLIAELERGVEAQEVFERSWLASVGGYSAAAALDAVVICCTHLTHVGELIARETAVPVIDVGRVLIELAATDELVLAAEAAAS